MGQHPNIGGDLDEVLRQDGTLAKVEAKARETVAAWQAAQLDLTWNQAAFEATHEEVEGAGNEVERVIRHYLTHPDIRPLLGRQRQIWFAYLRISGLANDTDRVSLEARLGRALGHEGADDRYFERRLANATIALSDNELVIADFLLKMIGY